MANRSPHGMGDRYGRGNRLSALLEPDAAAINAIKGDTQGIAYALQKGLQGLFAGMDAKDQSNVAKAFNDAFKKDKEITMETGSAYDPELEDAETDVGSTEMEPVVDKGRSYQERLMANLSGLDSRYANNAMRDVSSNLMAREQSARALADKRKYAEGQDTLKAQRAKQQYLYEQKNKKYPPKVPVPGRDTPLPPAVQAQKVEQYTARQPQFGPVPGRPDLQQSSTGQISKVPLSPMAQVQAEIAAKGELDQAAALKALPKLEADAKATTDLISGITNHPGMKGVVGMPDTVAGAVYKIFGTAPAASEEANFEARLKQLGGIQFLEAFKSLKGGGQITETEGRKATEAMSRMGQTGQSETAYLEAAKELQGIVTMGIRRARELAGQDPNKAPFVGKVPDTTETVSGQMPPAITEQQYNALPKGARYMHPDGNMKVKQ